MWQECHLYIISHSLSMICSFRALSIIALHSFLFFVGLNITYPFYDSFFSSVYLFLHPWCFLLLLLSPMFLMSVKFFKSTFLMSQDFHLSLSNLATFSLSFIFYMKLLHLSHSLFMVLSTLTSHLNFFLHLGWNCPPFITIYEGKHCIAV